MSLVVGLFLTGGAGPHSVLSAPEQGARALTAENTDVCPTVRLHCATRRCSRLLAKSASNLLKSMLPRLELAWNLGWVTPAQWKLFDQGMVACCEFP